MDYLVKVHKNFVNDLIKSSKLDDNFFTVLPTVIFSIGTFLLLFSYLHQYTSPYTRWKRRLYSDMMLHWSFFYITRIWLIFVKGCRWLLASFDTFVEDSLPQQEIYYNQFAGHLIIYLIATVLAFIPIVFFSLQRLYSRSIPNFLIWVGEDPWVRSEIGTSGHLLERPPPRLPPRKINSAYRSKRSTSVDADMGQADKIKSIQPRNCQSMMTI